MKTIKVLGDDFVQRHAWLLYSARVCGVMICGGCATAINKQIAGYEPPDIDLVGDEASALALVHCINQFMIGRECHYRIYANSRNKYVPSQATAHFRITTSIWKPICLFVIPADKVRYYRIEDGFKVQIHEDVKAAAEELTEVDGKERMASTTDVEDFVINLDADMPEYDDKKSLGSIKQND